MREREILQIGFVSLDIAQSMDETVDIIRGQLRQPTSKLERFLEFCH